ncbi:MAG: hypothetical protein AB1540_07000 [Bdellovibrionota bacterium]
MRKALLIISILSFILSVQSAPLEAANASGLASEDLSAFKIALRELVDELYEEAAGALNSNRISELEQISEKLSAFKDSRSYQDCFDSKWHHSPSHQESACKGVEVFFQQTLFDWSNSQRLATAEARKKKSEFEAAAKTVFSSERRGLIHTLAFDVHRQKLWGFLESLQESTREFDLSYEGYCKSGEGSLRCKARNLTSSAQIGAPVLQAAQAINELRQFQENAFELIESYSEKFLSCGTEGELKARLENCAKVMGDQATKTHEDPTTRERFTWSLVSQTRDGKQVWWDRTARLVWSDAFEYMVGLGDALAFCTNKELEKYGSLKGGIKGEFRLPTRGDFGTALAHGVFEVLPAIERDYWTVSQSSFNGGNLASSSQDQPDELDPHQIKKRLDPYYRPGLAHIRCVAEYPLKPKVW